MTLEELMNVLWGCNEDDRPIIVESENGFFKIEDIEVKEDLITIKVKEMGGK